MNRNTVKKFQNEEVINSIKKTLSVETINNSLINTPEKLILYAEYWRGRSVGATKELIVRCNIEIARAEATMLRMMDLTQDVLDVSASAYIDAVGFVPDDSIKEVIIDDKKDAKIVSILTGDEVIETPKLSDLSIAVRQLLKKNNFDSAMLLATQYLSVGNYIPKKDKQTAIKWEEAKIASWIKDINNTLLEEKLDISKETKTVIEPIEGNEDAAAKGLTLGEVKNLKSLKIISPKSIPGTNANYKALRNVLTTWLTVGNTLNIEDEMLWAIGSKIYTLVTSKDDTKTKELIDNLASVDDFCTAFFGHRGYTKESVSAWRDAIRKDKGISNFKYLRVNKDVDPLKLPKSGISYEAIEQRVKEEVIAGKSEVDILKGLDEGILYKEVLGKDSSIFMYTKLHTTDLINRMYSKYKNDSSINKVVPLSIGKERIAVEEIKLLISTIIENAGILDDVKSRPEILGLLNKEILITEKSPLLKFSNEATLFPWIETIFNEINEKIGKTKIANIKEAVDERKDLPTFSLDSMLTLAEMAYKEGVTQQKFVEEQKDLVLSKEGKWKNLTKSDNKGNKTTITLTNQANFEKWVSEVYAIQEKLKKHAESDVSVKPDEKPDILTRTDLEPEEIDTYIADLSRNTEATFGQLTKVLRDMYVKNSILIEDEICTLLLAMKEVDIIIEKSNPEMFAKRKESIENRKQAIKNTPELEVTTEPVQGPVKATDVEDAENEIFEKIDIKTVDSDLWKLIKDFKTLEEVHNTALEYMEANKFNYALSMCLEIMPSIEDSKDWNAEQITKWFNTNVLNKTENVEKEKSDVTDISENEDPNSENIGSVDVQDLKVSKNKRSTKDAVIAILKNRQDSSETRTLIINVLKSATGSHARQVGRMPDTEIHKYINNAKTKMDEADEV